MAQQATLTQTATIQSLSFYVTKASGKLRLGIFDATGPNGGPGTKKAETAEITPTVGWNKANVIAPVSLPQGTYWLAYLASDNNLAFVKNLSGQARYYAYSYGPMPATFSTSPESEVVHWSLFATLGTPGVQLPTHALTVINGSGGGNYPTGTQVPVSAETPPAGQEFARWTDDYVILANFLNSTTTATMPSVDATITATYRAVTTTSGDKIRYYPRAGYTHRMIGGVFEGTNGDPVIGPYTTIYTITTNPSTDGPEVGVSLGDYRYLRYRGPNTYYGNVAEIEFYRNGVKLNGTGYGTPGSWNNQGNTFDKALDGNVNTFFDAPTASGAYVGIDTGSGATL